MTAFCSSFIKFVAKRFLLHSPPSPPLFQPPPPIINFWKSFQPPLPIIVNAPLLGTLEYVIFILIICVYNFSLRDCMFFHETIL